MNLNRTVKHKISLTFSGLFAILFVSGQTATPAANQTVTSGYNQLATLLVIMIVVLAFVIWGMGQVLTALGRQLLNKNKSGNSTLVSILMLLGMSLLSQVSFAQGAPVPAVNVVANYGGLTETSYYLFLTVLATEVIVILFLAFSIRRMYTELLPEKIEAASRESKLAAWWSGLDKK